MASSSFEEDQDLSDAESSYSNVIDGPAHQEAVDFLNGEGMVELKEEDKECTVLKNKLYMGIGSLAQSCHVAAVHKITHSTTTAKARLGSFQLQLKAMKEKREGNPNVRYGWYGTSKNMVHSIVNHGFCVNREDSHSYGFGLYLLPEWSAIESVLCSSADKDGLSHVVLCRIILGNVEEVLPGSRQCCPSSEKFDSGVVVNEQSPTKYVVWYPDVNTHILPLYVLRVQLDFRSKGIQNEPVKKPTSPWIPINALISVLSKSFPPSMMFLVRRVHNDFMERKITRQQLILRIRELTGDKPLASAIKYFRHRANDGSNSSVNGRKDNVAMGERQKTDQ